MHAILAQSHEVTAAELPVPAEVIGVGAFVLLFILLMITLAFGKGREHS